MQQFFRFIRYVYKIPLKNPPNIYNIYYMKKNKKKAYIDTYETVYPMHLVVANEEVTLEQLKKLYCFSDNSILDDAVINGICTTSTVKRISDGRYMSLVKFNRNTDIKNIDKKLDLINTIAHEAVHVVLDTYDYIGEKVNAQFQEAFAYQVGWTAECIYKTLNKK